MIRLLLIYQIFLCFSLARAADEEPANPIVGTDVSWLAHVLRQNDSPGITNLKFSQERIPVMLVPHKKDLRPLVEIKVTYDRPDWTLFTPDGKPAKRGSLANEYVIFAFLNSQISELALTAKGPNSEKQTEMIYLFAPEAQEFQVVSPWNALSVSLGFTYLTYEQTLFGVLSSRGGMVGLDYISREGRSRWGYLGHLDMTILSLKSDPIDANPQLIDGRLLMSYRLPWGEQSRWRYKALFGLGYLSMISNGSPFGFSGLKYPDLAIRAQHYLSTKSSFIYEFRLVPLQNFSFEDQRGYHFSWTWSKTLKSLRRQDVILRYSDTQFTTDNQNIGVGLFSISLGYSI